MRDVALHSRSASFEARYRSHLRMRTVVNRNKLGVLRQQNLNLLILRCERSEPRRTHNLHAVLKYDG
jgi:hypothetical protein